jgi:hypothetical protein
MCSPNLFLNSCSHENPFEFVRGHLRKYWSVHCVALPTELNFADKEAYLRGEGLLTVPIPSPLDIKRFKRSVALSKAGLMLILIGGLFQVVSNYLPGNGH